MIKTKNVTHWKNGLPKKVFLTFGDGGENYVAARKRVAREARATGEFDEVLDYGLENASEAARNSPLKDYKRGCGYWMWKPDVVDSVLSGLDDGDILVWSDCGNVIYKTRQWGKFFRKLDSVDLIFKRISSCALHFHRKEMLELFAPPGGGIAPLCRMCFHFESNSIIMKKTPLSVQLIRDWKVCMHQHPECVKDALTQEELDNQLPSFLENRHDQSALTMVVYKYLSDKTAAHKIASVWEWHLGTWLWGHPAMWIARNRDGNSCRIGFKARLIRMAYRVIWGLQMLLERRGLQICWGKLK